MTTRQSISRLCAAAALLCVASSCSPGRLPGSPSPILSAGGGGRYNGTITYRRVGGAYAISEASQPLTLSIVLRDVDQVTGRFEAGETSGTLQGVIDGSLGAGSFQATALLVTMARQSGAAITCEGRGQVAGMLNGANLTWTTDAIAYENCPGLTATTQVQAVAVSPIPDPAGARASVRIAVIGSASVARGTCTDGTIGYPFVVEMIETAGLTVTFDPTFRIEEHRAGAAMTTTDLDMPFRELPGGGRRTYLVCSPAAGTYQAFFAGVDGLGNRVRVASPLVTLGR
jgi:hypothetical protein